MFGWCLELGVRGSVLEKDKRTDTPFPTPPLKSVRLGVLLEVGGRSGGWTGGRIRI